MGRGSSKAGGGGGGSNIRTNSQELPVSPLEAFKEDARQLTEALKTASRMKAAEVVYHSMTGQTVRRYWDGGKYSDRPNSMARRYSSNSGVFEITFQEPADWKNRR